MKKLPAIVLFFLTPAFLFAQSIDSDVNSKWMKYESPKDIGWSEEGLQDAEDYFDRITAAAVMVIYKGNVLVSWGEVDKKFMCHSMRKSFLSVMYGIYVDNGSIDISKNLKALKINDKLGLKRVERTATIKHLLQSRSGVYHPAAYESAAAQHLKPARGTHKPGENWHYNNWDFNTLVTIFNQEADIDFFNAFEKEIANPIGMESFDLEKDTYYHYEKNKSRHPAYPFLMSAKDLARFGQLVLNRGLWGQNQLVPAAWIDESTTSYSSNGYGYMWWREDYAWGKIISAKGVGGHSLEIVPEKELVVVIRTNTFDREGISPEQRNRLMELILNSKTDEVSTDIPKLVPIH